MPLIIGTNLGVPVPIIQGGTGATTAAAARTALGAGTGNGDVTLTGTQTLSNKTLTTPTINSPTGIVKGDVGLSNVDNTSDSTKNSAAVTLTNKTLTTPTITVPDIVGRTDGGNAAVGSVGEFLTQTRLLSAATAMTTTVSQNVTATPLTLTAGDYDVSLIVGVSSGSGTVLASLVVACSLTSATLPASDTNSVALAGEIRVRKQYGTTVGITMTSASLSEPISSFRISINATSTFYLVAQAAFTVAGLSVFGNIAARRRD